MARARTIAIYRPVSHTITGRPDEVAASLRRAEAEGRLLTDPDRIAASVARLPGGLVRCTAVLMTPQAPVTPVPNRLWRGIAGALAGVALVFAAFYALGLLLVALIGPLTLAASLVVLSALVWAVLSARRRRAACRGLHCAGCAHR